ncbi:uncharacterized protein LOC144175177 [Haemaphysalis longicornis]
MDKQGHGSKSSPGSMLRDPTKAAAAPPVRRSRGRSASSTSSRKSSISSRRSSTSSLRSKAPLVPQSALVTAASHELELDSRRHLKRKHRREQAPSPVDATEAVLDASDALSAVRKRSRAPPVNTEPPETSAAPNLDTTRDTKVDDLEVGELESLGGPAEPWCANSDEADSDALLALVAPQVSMKGSLVETKGSHLSKFFEVLLHPSATRGAVFGPEGRVPLTLCPPPTEEIEPAAPSRPRRARCIFSLVIVVVIVLVVLLLLVAVLPHHTGGGSAQQLCSSSDCVEHARRLGVGRADAKRASPCEDFGLFVCSAATNRYPWTAQVLSTQMLLDYLTALGSELPTEPVLARPTLAMRACMDSSSRDDGDAQRLVDFVRGRSFDWPASDDELPDEGDYSKPIKVHPHVAPVCT